MTRFSDALRKTADILDACLLEQQDKLLVIRDIYGRISFAVDSKRDSVLAETLDTALAALETFRGRPGIFFQDDLFDPDAVFRSPHIVRYVIPDSCSDSDRSIRLLDRQVTGHDWSSSGGNEESVPTFVFYGVKGGVGRSTALAVVAYQLAAEGKNVLLMDLDLESPGLSGLVLPLENAPNFGIVDWLVEDAVGNATDLCQQLVVDSPISKATGGRVRIAPAMGRSDSQYLDKLSRVYADVPDAGRGRTFSDRLKTLLDILKAQEKPNVVLVDSRAGLHDLAALGIVRLATTAFLFATNSEQSWQAYRSLFQFWQHRPDVAMRVREKLKVVRALFPETDQARQTAEFLEKAHALFTDTLYDEAPSMGGNPGEEPFNFSLQDADGPHHPVRVNWDSRFQEFNPLLLAEGVFDQDQIRAVYGPLLDAVGSLLPAGGDQ